MTLVIGIITTIITILIVALEVMIGYERGVQRNIIRTLMLVGVAVVTLYATSPVVDIIVRKLIVTDKLYDYLYSLTGVQTTGFFFLKESAVNMFSVFLNPFVYVVMFWAFKFITFGIYLLMDRYIINRRFTKLFPRPSKKSCIAGAFLGGIYAIMIGAIFFMPVSAYSELLQKTEKAAITEGAPGTVSELLGASRYRVAVGYLNTPSYYFYKYTGTKLLGDLMFTSLTRKEVDATTVSANQYIPSLVKVYHASKVLKRGLSQRFTLAEYEEYKDALNIIIEQYSTKELILGTEEEKLTFVNAVLKNSAKQTDNELLQSMMVNMDYSSIVAFSQDIETLTEFSTLMMEKGILDEIMNSAADITPREFIQILDEATIDQMTGKLYSLDQAKVIVPLIAEKLLGVMLGDGKLGDSTVHDIENFAATEQDFLKICNAGKQLASLINKDMPIEKAEIERLLNKNLAVLEKSELIDAATLESVKEIINQKLIPELEQIR